MALAAAGLQTQSVSLDTVANNLANLDTPGFAATVPLTASGVASVQSAASGTPPTAVLPQIIHYSGAQFQPVRTVQQGSVQVTGNPIDVALLKPGYMEFQTPQGKTVLSRDGALQVDGSGQLVDSFGARVLDQNGKPIVISAGDTNPAIANDGSVTAIRNGATVTVAKLGFVSVANPQGLVAQGNGWLQVTASSGAPIPATMQVMGGAVEASNVDVAAMMTTMMQISANMSFSANLVQYSGQMLSTLDHLV